MSKPSVSLLRHPHLQLAIRQPSRAHESLTFPGESAKTAAHRAARRFTLLYRVQFHARPEAPPLTVNGAPQDFARFRPRSPQPSKGPPRRL